MWFFKKKPFKEIDGGAWGYLVSKFNIDVDTLSREMRCVKKRGTLAQGIPVTFLRVFRLKDLEMNGVTVEGWETFDRHRDMIAFEGYVTDDNEAHLEPVMG
ncbi:MAG: hypothetical protein AB1512_13100 [Thermodesulfobacteriota bacterium]